MSAVKKSFEKKLKKYVLLQTVKIFLKKSYFKIAFSN
tara:strand:- start:4641 stop:4751 length:111 start_codon:yes stop_codon:yes gene_type:complete